MYDYEIVLSLLLLVIFTSIAASLCLKYSHSTNRTTDIDTRLNRSYCTCRMNSSGHLEVNPHQITSSHSNSVVVEANLSYQRLSFDNHGNKNIKITGSGVQVPPNTETTSRHSSNNSGQPPSSTGSDDGFMWTANPNYHVMPNTDPDPFSFLPNRNVNASQQRQHMEQIDIPCKQPLSTNV